MDNEKTKVAFFVERKSRRGNCGAKLPREVTAVFVEFGDCVTKQCYAHTGQHSVCSAEWLAENCRPATYAEYKALMDELQNLVGYDIEVIDGEWWLAATMEIVRGTADNGNGKAA